MSTSEEYNPDYQRRPISQQKSGRMILQLVALLFSLALAFSARTFPSEGILQFAGLVGGVVAFYVFGSSAQHSLRHQRHLGLTILTLGGIFWFWKEVIVFSTSHPIFPNTSAVTPFSGQQLPLHIVAESLFCLTLFSLVSVATWQAFGSAKFLRPKWLTFNNSNKVILVDIVLVLFAVSGWKPFLDEFGGVQESFARMLLMRQENLEFSPGLSVYLPILSISAASYALVRLVLNVSGSRALCIMALLIGGTIAVLSGTRFKVAFLLMPAMICILTQQGSRLVRLRNLAIILVFVLGSSFAALFQILYRYGSRGLQQAAGLQEAISGAEHFTAFAHAVWLAERMEHFFMQSMLPLFFTDFVPRFIWPGKPMHEYWEYYNSKIAILGGNVTPSVLGQYYLNWGWVGSISVGVIFGLWARYADNLVDHYQQTKNHLSIALAGIILTFLFLSFRVYTANYITYVLVVYMFYLIFLVLNLFKLSNIYFK